MPDPADRDPAAARLVRWAWVVFGVQVCFAAWALTRGWSATLIDQHEYRQAQTALSAFWMLRETPGLAYPLPVFGPPWSVPFEFPLYQGLVAAWAGLTGSSIETAGRSLSALMLLLSLPAIWRLGRVLDWSRPSRILAMASVLSAPVFLFYGRAILIETTALCLSVWFLAHFASALEKPGVKPLLLAAGFGALAGLAKVTTFIVFLLPAALLVLRQWRTAGLSRRLVLAAAVPAGFALAAATAWVKWSDHVKRANPFAEAFTSSAMTQWTLGTLGQRMSGDFWSRFWHHTTEGVLAVPALVVVALLITLVPAGPRRQAAGLVLGYVGGVLLFANLFFIHDYYYCANAALLLGASGLLLGAGWESAALPRAAKIVATLILFGAQAWNYDWVYGHHFRRGSINPPPIAGLIRENTNPGDVVIYYGCDWGALIPYYAERRAIMVPAHREADFAALDRVLANLPPARVAGLYVLGPNAERKDFARERAARLGLVSAPIVANEQELFFLRSDLIAAAHRRLSQRPVASLPLALGASSPDPAFVRQEFPAGSLPMLVPFPAEIRGKFPLGVLQHEGQAVFSTHAPAEFRFTAPAGSRRITIEAGMLPGAYEPGADATDGVDIVISEVVAPTLRRELFRRAVRPQENDSDRAALSIQFEREEPFTADIVVAVTPGPADHTTKDWAYFKRIEFR